MKYLLQAERQKILAEFHKAKDRDEARELFHKLKHKIRKHDGLTNEIAQHVYGRLPEGKQTEMF